MVSEELLSALQLYINENYVDLDIECCAAPLASKMCSDSIDSVLPAEAENAFILDESFSKTLLRKIDESGLTDAECYKRAQLNRAHFNKIKNDESYNVQKSTVLALALALKLNRKDTGELLLKAGYALSKSCMSDVIIEYCIEHEIFDVITVNQLLYKYDQKLLGAGMRE